MLTFGPPGFFDRQSPLDKRNEWVEADDGHWFAQRCPLILNFDQGGSSFYRNLGYEKAIKPAQGGNSRAKLDRYGYHYADLTEYGAVSYLNLGTHPVLQVDECSGVIVFRRTGGYGGIYAEGATSGSPGDGFYLTHNGTSYTLNVGGLSTSLSIDAWEGPPWKIAWSWKNGGPVRVAVDGRAFFTGTHTLRTLTHGLAILGAGDTGSSYSSYPHNIYLFALAPGETSMVELVELSARPSQLLKPRKPVLYYADVAAGGSTYNETMTVSLAAAITQSLFFEMLSGVNLPVVGAHAGASSLEALSGIGLQSVNSELVAGGFDLVSTVAMQVLLSVSDAVERVMQVQATVSSAQGLTPGSQVDLVSGVALAVAHALSPTAQAALLAAMSLPVTAAQTDVGGSDFLEAISLATTQAISASVTQAMFSGVTLAVIAAQSVSSLATLNSQVSLSAVEGFAASGLLSLDATITLQSVLGTSDSGELVYDCSVVLSSQGAVAATAKLDAVAVLPLQLIAQLNAGATATFEAQISIAVVPTSDLATGTPISDQVALVSLLGLDFSGSRWPQKVVMSISNVTLGAAALSDVGEGSAALSHEPVGSAVLSDE